MEDGIYRFMIETKGENSYRIALNGVGYNNKLLHISDFGYPDFYIPICPISKIALILYGFPENTLEILNARSKENNS